jgi:phage-related minor tail protein
MIFIQQGGQLKDTLGGPNMALRAVAEYVMGLINPFTVAAVAVGVLALAYNQGSKEADAYRLALVNTGNAAGVTTGQMAGMAKHVSDSVGTTGAAAEALTALASTGVVAGANMEKFATSAIWAHKGLGQEVGETPIRFYR